MSVWTHSICSECFKERYPDREPVRVKYTPVEQCCFCGKPTSMGIYIRFDPKELKFCDHD